jgi:type IV secretion system protein VirD4
MLRDPAVRNHARNNNCDGDTALFQVMQEVFKDLFDDFIVGIASQFLSMGEKERGSILSTARTQTAFLDSPRLQRTLVRSDFALADLKLRNTTLYLCLPASRMGSHARWLRTIITLALQECERVTEKPPLPVLFVLDEFAVLGHMRAIEVAAGQMAGFDVKLWTILQDLSQLKHAYQGTWETFFANAAIATFHGISDVTTLEYLSKRLGTRTVTTRTDTAVNYNDVAAGRPMEQESKQQQPLAATHELELALARERGRMVVLFPGSHPLILQRAIYYEDPLFAERLT